MLVFNLHIYKLFITELSCIYHQNVIPEMLASK